MFGLKWLVGDHGALPKERLEEYYVLPSAVC